MKKLFTILLAALLLLSCCALAEDAGLANVMAKGKLITGTSAGCAVKFALALVAAMGGFDAAQKVSDQIVIR